MVCLPSKDNRRIAQLYSHAAIYAGGGHCWNACCYLLLQGPHKIAEHRATVLAGQAKESAVEAALKLLEVAMQMEDAIFDILKARSEEGAPLLDGQAVCMLANHSKSRPYSFQVLSMALHSILAVTRCQA